jgi:hypothetical protein
MWLLLLLSVVMVPSGLPEEVAIAAAALSEGYFVLALSSQDRRINSSVWNVPSGPGVKTADTEAVRGSFRAGNVDTWRLVELPTLTAQTAMSTSTAMGTSRYCTHTHTAPA